MERAIRCKLSKSKQLWTGHGTLGSYFKQEQASGSVHSSECSQRETINYFLEGYNLWKSENWRVAPELEISILLDSTKSIEVLTNSLLHLLDWYFFWRHILSRLYYLALGHTNIRQCRFSMIPHNMARLFKMFWVIKCLLKELGYLVSSWHWIQNSTSFYVTLISIYFTAFWYWKKKLNNIILLKLH